MHYTASIAPCWLHTPILPALLHLRPSECLFFYLLQATKVNLLAHAKSVTPPTPLFRWSLEKWERSHNNDTEEIYRIGKPHGKKDPVRGLPHAETEFSSVGHVLRSNQEVTLRDSLNSLVLQTCGGGSLTDYTWRSRVLQRGFSGKKAVSAGFRLPPA